MRYIKVNYCGKLFKFPHKTTFDIILQNIHSSNLDHIVAVKYNKKIYELFKPCMNNGILEIISINSMDGIRIYRRTLTFVLYIAIKELYPSANLKVQHSLNKGVFCKIENIVLDKQTLSKINNRMNNIINQDFPIVKKKIETNKAIKLLNKEGNVRLARLLSSRTRRKTNLYFCRKHCNYFSGYMLKSTGQIKRFDLKKYKDGFILITPVPGSDYKLPKYRVQKKLAQIYFEYVDWAKILDIEVIDHLNQKISKGQLDNIINITEALQERKIVYISDIIKKRKKRVKVIFVSGPSSSGKTTFANRLKIQLSVNGYETVIINMDNYFKSRRDTPKDENGNYDFECPEALDMNLLISQIKLMLKSKSICLPVFDFLVGCRRWSSEKIDIKENTIIIIEGIHGLNPKITDNIISDRIYKIYVSPLTQLNIDDYNRIPTRDTRILRRLVRDSFFRGNPPERTFKLWNKVVSGEEKYIFPYQSEADIIFNSALIYEHCILKNYVEKLLKQYPKTGEHISDSQRLLRFIRYFKAGDPNLVPLNSILREFIGK